MQILDLLGTRISKTKIALPLRKEFFFSYLKSTLKFSSKRMIIFCQKFSHHITTVSLGDLPSDKFTTGAQSATARVAVTLTFIFRISAIINMIVNLASMFLTRILKCILLVK